MKVHEAEYFKEGHFYIYNNIKSTPISMIVILEKVNTMFWVFKVVMCNRLDHYTLGSTFTIYIDNYKRGNEKWLYYVTDLED